MEFQGYALAAVVVLLLAYVAPYLHRRRMVLAEARIDERYAEDLRLLAVRDARVDSPRAHNAIGEHGTVFFRRPEVMMSSLDESANAGQSSVHTPVTTGVAARRKPAVAIRQPTVKAPRRPGKAGEIRSLAKERARRHARISKRAALQKRGLAGGIGLGVFAIVTWVLALSAVSWPVVIAAMATGLVGLYFIGFSYVVGEISAANIRDREAIDDINAKLGGSSRKAAEAPHPAAEPETVGVVTRDAAERTALQAQETIAGACTNAQKASTSNTAAEQTLSVTAEDHAVRTSSAERHTGISVTMDPRIVSEGAVVHGRNSQPAAQNTSTPKVGADSGAVGSAPIDVAAASTMPSYTLKPRTIERRTVTPYQAPAEPEAEVPYRPKQVGERIGDVTDTRKAESEKPAADKLGGGAVLDHLLDRRRA